MKVVSFLVILIFSLNVNASDFITFPDANTGIKKFFEPLQKEGAKGIDKTLKSTMNDMGESAHAVNQEMGREENAWSKQLKNVMVNQQQGKVLSYKMNDETVRLNNKMIKREYTVYFEGGGSKTMNFVFLKPLNDQDYQLVDVKVQE